MEAETATAAARQRQAETVEARAEADAAKEEDAPATDQAELNKKADEAAARVKAASGQACLSLLEWLVYQRSMWYQLSYGDQGLALTRQNYDLVGGYFSLPLMEDLDLVQRLQKLGKLLQTPAKIKVSGRRWQRLGLWPSCWHNAKLPAAWRRSIDPSLLADSYC